MGFGVVGKRLWQVMGFGVVGNQWLCKRCGSQKRCTDFKGYLYPRRVIDTAVYLRIKGLKLADVQQSLERIFEMVVVGIGVGGGGRLR